MNLIERLELSPDKDRVVSLVGSGGKTTLLYLLARMAAADSRRTAVTTSTHILRPREPDLDVLRNGDFSGFEWTLSSGKIAVAGSPAPDGKLSAPDSSTLQWLVRRTDLLLIEADGSKGLPVKFPNATEPVLLPQTKRVIALAGLSALGKPLESCCHRAALAAKALEVAPDQPVTPALLARLLLAGYNRFNPTVLLNQADIPELQQTGEEIAALLRAGGIKQVLVTSLKQEVSRCLF